ncbi:MAG: ParB/RepB/Spo0J family partition protein [Paracoccaceae bacterium]
MARRRLGPADPTSLAPRPAPETKSGPPFPAAPIAQVAGEAATIAALDDITRELAEARETGRMVIDLPLDAVVADHLARDRILAEDEEMTALRDSILAHGQRTPIEVTPLDTPGRYGLISGWRRLTALKTLHDWLGQPRFATVRALVCRPESAAGAYVAMVEENEIRVGLSHYERARIVALSVARGVFPDGKEALKALFGNVSRAKRSKIGAFLRLYDHLDEVLRFPAVLGERLGLKLAAAIGEGNATMLRTALEKADAKTPQEEQEALQAALLELDRVSRASRWAVEKEELWPGVTLTYRSDGRRRSMHLSGPGLKADFCDMLRDMLVREGETRTGSA